MHMNGVSEFLVCPGAAHTRGPFSIAVLAASLAAEAPARAAVWSKNEAGIPPGPPRRMPSQKALVAICGLVGTAASLKKRARKVPMDEPTPSACKANALSLAPAGSGGMAPG